MSRAERGLRPCWREGRNVSKRPMKPPTFPVLVPMTCMLVACGGQINELIHKGDGGISGGPFTSHPVAPPAKICDSPLLLGGPTTPPREAVNVPAGDNAAINFGRADTTYWFAPGLHTLGTVRSSQIIPGDNSTFIGAPAAIIDGQNVNAYAFTQHAVNVRIAYLEIRNFVSPNNEGVVNHDGGEGWVIEYNYMHHNGGAAVFVSSGNVLRSNCLRDNHQYGFQGIGPGGGGAAVGITLDHNEIAHNATDAVDGGGGCGCAGGGKFWDVNGAVVTSNWVHDNLSAGLWADTNNRNFLVEGNYVENNYGEAIIYEISYNAQIRRNTFKRNALGKGREFAARNDNFPVATIYVSEAGGDSRVPGTPTIEIGGNYFEDNWSGVTLWENADRFCNSPANSSASHCTLVSAEATRTSCAQPGIATAPLYDDCRWKTQNVDAHDNEFHVTPANIGCTNDFCTRQAILSNWGTLPSWSPYMGPSISNAVTFSQNNRFRSNRYFGPWRFVARDTSVDIDFASWQAAPYGQDPGSTMQ
jgi:parallel beta helix pectate lyase-like protein